MSGCELFLEFRATGGETKQVVTVGLNAAAFVITHMLGWVRGGDGDLLGLPPVVKICAAFPKGL